MRSLPSPLREALLAMTGPLWAVALAAAAVAGPKATVTSLSVQQIIERNVAARGGLERWRAVGTMAWVGHIESAHAPVPNMRFTLEQQRPNKTRFEVNALGQKAVRVFDGTQGWKLRAAQNVGRPDAQPFAAEELKFARAGQGIDGPDLGLRVFPARSCRYCIGTTRPSRDSRCRPSSRPQASNPGHLHLRRRCLQ